MYRRILIPTDGSKLSELAIGHGVALAKALGAEVIGFTVFPTFSVFAVEPLVIANTPEQHEKDCAAVIPAAAARDMGSTAHPAARREQRRQSRSWSGVRRPFAPRAGQGARAATKAQARRRDERRDS